MAAARRLLGLLLLLPLLAWGQAAPIRYDLSQEIVHPVAARHGLVASDHYLASQVGADILRRGGNAVDAAVAVGFALAVVYPSAGNLGGGGFMLVHEAATGRQVALDFREMAPAGANRDMYLDAAGQVVPGRSSTQNVNAGHAAGDSRRVAKQAYHFCDGRVLRPL